MFDVCSILNQWGGENSYSSSSISTKERGVRNLLSFSLSKKEKRKYSCSFSLIGIFALWLLLDEQTERDVLHLFLQLSMGEEEGSGRTSPQLALLGKKSALPIVL